MAIESPIDCVYVVPRNGYANRLQAWASSAILAAFLDAPLRVVWEQESIASAAAQDLFATSLIDRFFSSTGDLEKRLGQPHGDLPRYLNYFPEHDLIVLAGHDAGEQAFMNELVSCIDTLRRPATLVIIAGGRFCLPDDHDFDIQRRIFYRDLRWSDSVVSAFDALHHDHAAFAALHIRQTDRSIEAPTSRQLRSGLERLTTLVPERELFIAADTEQGREAWARKAELIGFRPWFAPNTSFDRATRNAGVAALVDWRLLASASGLVYPAASTFSAEAVVAGGTVQSSVALTSRPSRQRARRWGRTATTVLSYPRRHWLTG